LVSAASILFDRPGKSCKKTAEHRDDSRLVTDSVNHPPHSFRDARPEHDDEDNQNDHGHQSREHEVLGYCLTFDPVQLRFSCSHEGNPELLAHPQSHLQRPAISVGSNFRQKPLKTSE